MATRKALVLVSGLFQELNSSSDKLDFAGNTTADLTEQTNLYYTDARSRAAVSVTDSGGDGSLAYNSSTGVITYTGPSASEARAHLSVASGSGLSYNSSTGEFGTSAIPNGQLANSSLTIGSTSVSLGATQGTFTGLTSLASGTLVAGVEDAANAIEIGSGNIIFEGSTADANETILTAADATGGDKTLTLPNETGTILSTASSIANSNLTNSAVTVGSTSISLGGTVTTFTGLSSLTSTTLVGTTLISGSADAANSIKLASGNIVFEGSSANDFETTFTVTNPTADRTITLPDAAGTVALLGSLSVAAGSGLTYNSGTGQFGTSSIPNAQLANSTVTIGSTAVALGASATTFTGLAALTATGQITAAEMVVSRATNPQITFTDTDNTPDYRIRNNDGVLEIIKASNAAVRLAINTDGHIDINDDLDVSGEINTTKINLTDTKPKILFTESDSNPDYRIVLHTGNLGIEDTTNSNAARFVVNSDGHVDIPGNLDVGAGIDVTGNVNATGNLDLPDSASGADGRLMLGTGDDVQIYHTGSATKFDFYTSSVEFTNSASESLAKFNLNSSIELYHDGTKKFETSSTGVTVTGVCTATSFTGALNSSVTATTQSASDNSTKVATTAYVDNQVTAGAVNEFVDNVFRVKDNSDASKKLAFECSGISGSTTRTMTVPDSDGTISTESFATAIAVALG